ncbi:Protein-export membrane protein SecD [Mycoplasmopsis meleagridis]|uniref:Protein-export membrane protein SecD n=1 Tax=Mycoplasmopsis meleagridis ATCC 25294 TaxID=1264554 RepID=A0A0F5H1S1_9BACT|nr:protein translocase subunit SecDF [Mycoplasmopsis meleagridis]KKB26787.1 Protein-export membrane protein SecD [Mycoplasmopsis meleagridis ATCC 25294]OAD18096.1 Protein-export membrane protein SecD [Mycoplasmopsis meleagridis]VEU77322.1 bifunctional preprotein translocase subunit SecD/SecF [Mycoplasmopsis meleagridis]
MFSVLTKTFKNIFSLSNWKRIAIILITLIASICAIVFGSFFYLSKNVNKSVDYTGGIKYLVEIDNKEKLNDDKFTKKVANIINDRLTGGSEYEGIVVIPQEQGKILIEQKGNLSDNERYAFQNLITQKPNLILTDTDMIPLFVDGKFNKDKEEINYNDLARYYSPLKPNSASVQYGYNNSYSIKVDLLDKNAENEWTNATAYISNTTSKTLLMWLNIDKLVYIAQNDYSKEWENSKKNPYNFIHVNESVEDEKTKQPNALKENQINVNNFLISTSTIYQPANGESFYIRNDNLNNQSAKKLAANINFSISPYSLNMLSEQIEKPNLVNGILEKALIAGIVIFIIVAIFMLVNYGLLGALNTISSALYIFLTLLMFTILRGEYSPVTIVALIIGFAISLDASITNFERLKGEIYHGDKLKKAIKRTYSLSSFSILDANISALIIAFILFYFGTNSVRGLSLLLVFSFIFTLLIMLILNRILSTLLVSTGWFNKRLWLLGINYKKVKKLNGKIFYKRFDYYRNSKWFNLAILLIIIIGLIVYSSIAAHNNNAQLGLNLSLDFKGGKTIYLEGFNTSPLNLNEANSLRDLIIQNQDNLNIKDASSYVKVLPINMDNSLFKVAINYPYEIDVNTLETFVKSHAQYANINFISFDFSNSENKQLVINSLIAFGVSLLGLFIYSLIRFKWTYAIAMIISLVSDILVILAFLAITRVEISPIIIAGILGVFVFSVNNMISIFSKIRENTNSFFYHDVLSKKQVKYAINNAIIHNLKRTLYLFLVLTLAAIILFVFNDATNWRLNLILLIGTLVSSNSSIFVSTYILGKLETKRQLGIKKRQEKKYWEFNNKEEQTFVGINDFIA